MSLPQPVQERHISIQILSTQPDIHQGFGCLALATGQLAAVCCPRNLRALVLAWSRENLGRDY